MLRRLVLPSLLLAALMPNGARADSPLKMTLETPRTAYFLGEPFALYVHIQNTSDQRVDFTLGGDMRSSNRSERFFLTATDQLGRIADDPDPWHNNFGGRIDTASLGPGESLWAIIAPLDYCRILTPGVYTLKVGHDLSDNHKESIAMMYGKPPPVSFDGLVTGSIVLSFELPTEAQAESIVHTAEHSPSLPWQPLKEKPTLETLHDFNAFCVDPYIRPLRQRALNGDAEGVQGLASIWSPESTRALVSLLPRNIDLLQQPLLNALSDRLPRKQFLPDAQDFLSPGTQSRYPIYLASWRDEFASPVAQWLAPLADQPGRLGESAAYYLPDVATADQLPAFVSKSDLLLASDAVIPSGNFRAAGNADKLLSDTERIATRANTWPDDPRSLTDQALFLHHLARDPFFRPANWEARWLQLAKDPHPLLRERAALAAAHLNAAPASFITSLADHLADPDDRVRWAAVNAAQLLANARLGPPLVAFIRNEPRSVPGAGPAAIACGQRLQYLLACIDALAVPETRSYALDDLTALFPDGISSYKILDIPAAQAAWRDFLSAHRDAIDSGEKLPASAADTLSPAARITLAFLSHNPVATPAGVHPATLPVR